VNVKTYGKQESILDINPEGLPDYYLVFTGDKASASSSKGKERPFVVRRVYLFEAKRLFSVLSERGVKIGVATSVASPYWEEAELFPQNRNHSIELSDEQFELLKVFNGRRENSSGTENLEKDDFWSEVISSAPWQETGRGVEFGASVEQATSRVDSAEGESIEPQIQGETPLVLVFQERTMGGRYDHWQDIEGERIHFPNRYKNKLTPGRPFVYFKGVRRRDGKRAIPEYFGWGRLGKVWRDDSISEDEPKNKWRWFCSIEEYQAFDEVVCFKREDGSTYEDVRHNNHWRDGVRDIGNDAFKEILSEAGLSSM